MQHKVIQNLKAASGDKGLFSQWHEKFATALGQVDATREKIVHWMVKELDLCKDMEAVVIISGNDYVTFGKTEAEACHKIKMITHGEGFSTRSGLPLVHGCVGTGAG